MGSGLIKGIGPVYAKRIVNQFKEVTLAVLEESPDDLIEIEGIGPKRVAMIRQVCVEQKEVKNIMVFFRPMGSLRPLATVSTEPMAKDHPGAYPEQLVEKAVESLAIEEPKVIMTIDHMVQSDEIIKDSDVYYLPPFFYSEVGTARRLRRIAAAERGMCPSVPQATDGFAYDELQLQAIRTAQTAKVMMLTGGPGTGKTTTLKGIILVCQRQQRKILLAAPTGRAAKRMSETTGLEAKTIHRLLEFKPTEGYKRNADRPLVADVVILDEASMIDIVPMYNLLKAIPDEATVVIVGDVDPSLRRAR